MSRKLINGYFSTLFGALVIVAGTTSPAFAGGDRLECKGESARGDSSMDARYEVDEDRAKFSVSFEAAPGGASMAGDVKRVEVGGNLVGYITLAGELGGDLGGDLNFDSTAGPADQDRPFPANFPAVGAGDVVSVGTLGCDLQSR